jgi:hypothetical protein
MDREELPFNRAERSWVYRAAKKVDTTIAFGSTRPLDLEGEVFFLNSAFPILEKDIVDPVPVTIGGGRLRNTLYHQLDSQHLWNEFWRYLQTGGAGIVQWREKSRHLDEYR